MIAIQKILYPTDFSSDARQALNHALFLAEQLDAELHMLHVMTLHNDDPYNVAYHFETVEDLDTRLQALATSEMAGLLEPHQNDVLKVVQVQRKESHPVPAILAYIQEAEIDLVVMGTRGRRGLSRMLQGSVTEETVRLAPCPVLTVHSDTEQTAVDQFSKILVPVEFSEHSKQALLAAVELAQTYNASLQLVHVLEAPVMPDYYMSMVGSIASDTLELMERSAYESLERMMEPYQSQDNCPAYSSHVIHGRATVEITEFAQEHNSDLIVLSTHGLTGLQRVVFGSVAEHVVRLAECPVFTVKAFTQADD